MTETVDGAPEQQDAAVVAEPDVEAPDIETADVETVDTDAETGEGQTQDENPPEGQDMADDSEAQASGVAIASDDVDVTRSTLEMLSKKPEDFNKELDRLKKSKNPEHQALAADLEMAQKQMELTELDNKIAQAESTGLGQAEKTRMGRRKEELRDEIKSMGGQRESITNQGEAIPNQVESLSKKLGITETNNPLGEITNEINKLVEMGRKQRKEMYAGYKESGMTEDETKFLDDAIKAIRTGEKLKGVGKVAEYLGAVSLIFTIMTVFKSIKESEEGPPRQ